jgi:hypothetical protein
VRVRRTAASWLTCAALSLAGASPAETPAFAVGQHWSYDTREEDPKSTLIVGRVEELPGQRLVVHISVIDLNLHGPDGMVMSVVAHVPISAEALRKSVKQEVPPVPSPDEFAGGYETWRRAKGGVYTIPVREVIETIERTVNAPAPQGQ